MISYQKFDDEINSSFGEISVGYHHRSSGREVSFISDFQKFLKRFFDVLFSTFFLILFAPVYVLLSLLIKFTSQGPVFIKQSRIGLHKRTFELIEFRTQYLEYETQVQRQKVENLIYDEDADHADVLEEYLSYLGLRITPVGHFLKTFGLNELPYLFNVLKGDMSIVGPKAHHVHEVESYKNWYKRRLSMKPGLIGWDKMNLNAPPKNYEESILYDLWYVDQWRLSLDFRIMFKTIPYVIFN